jgi:small-conductance mechanosensitive channel
MATVVDYGLMIFVSALAVIALIYIFLHMDNLLYYYKLKKDRRIGDDTMDVLFDALKVLWASLAIMFLIELAVFRGLDYAEEVARIIYDYVFAIFIFCLVFVVVWFIAKLGTRGIERSIDRSMTDPNAYVKTGFLDFYEMFVKYFIYAMGLIFATFIALAAIPDEEQRQRVFDWMGLASLDMGELASTVSSYIVLLIVFFLIWKLASVVLDDFKKKSKKFPPRVIDLVKALVRYGLIWLAMVVTLTIILDLFNFQYVELVVYLIIAATFTVLLVVAFSPTTKEGFSGVVLLLTDSVNKDDWIAVAGIAEGRVVSQNLLTTRLEAENGEILDIPNSRMTSTSVANRSKVGYLEATMALPKGVPDEEILKRVASVEGICHEPAPEIVETISADGSVTRVMRYRITDYRRQRAAAERLTQALLGKGPEKILPSGR